MTFNYQRAELKEISVLITTGRTDMYGIELFLSLTPGDQAFVGMFAGASFGGDVTLPSGRTLTGEQMESIRQSQDAK